ncbi:hypothetical protein HNV12_02320 [Methanococcoides sp. SA1]|nr:hypothetical protein [Methanococcoides sp. SA1]
MVFRDYGDGCVFGCSEEEYLKRVEGIVGSISEKYGKDAGEEFRTEEMMGLKRFNDRVETSDDVFVVAGEQSRRKLAHIRGMNFQRSLEKKLN